MSLRGSVGRHHGGGGSAGVCAPGENAARGAALPTRTVLSPGSTIMYGALLLFESEFVHIVAISFTSLILTELLMVALTIQTWHWLMTVAELLSLACYIASLVFLHEFIGETPAPAWEACLLPPEVSPLEKEGSPGTGVLGSVSSRPWPSTAPLRAVPWAVCVSHPGRARGQGLSRESFLLELDVLMGSGEDSVTFSKGPVGFPGSDCCAGLCAGWRCRVPRSCW